MARLRDVLEADAGRSETSEAMHDG